MRLPSASKVERVLACPASHALPQEQQKPSLHADAGTARHEALANWLAGRTVRGDESLAGWLTDVSEAAEELRGHRQEVALAYDVAFGAARIIGENIGRRYGPLAPSEIAGSADYLFVGADHVEVVDLKTGRGEVAPPHRNAQLLTLAVAARAVYGRDLVEVRILHAPDGGPVWWDNAPDALGRRELDAHADALAVMAERVAEASDDVARGRNPRHMAMGPHCRYCPAKPHCPAHRALERGTVESPRAQVDGWRALMVEGKRAEVLRLWRVAKEALEEVGTALHASASESPIDIGNGEVWGPKVTEREVIDAEAAWPVLANLLGTDGARAAMTLDTSKAGVERGVKAAKAAGALSGTVKAGVAAALQALRANGAVTTKTRTEFTTYPAPVGMVSAGVDAGEAGAQASSPTGPVEPKGNF